MKAIIAMTIAATLAGCASSPDQITAAPVAGGQYAAYSCQQLHTMLASARDSRVRSEQALRSEQTKDAMIVTGAVLFMPVAGFAAMQGNANKEQAVAASKGQVIAIEQQLQSRC